MLFHLDQRQSPLGPDIGKGECNIAVVFKYRLVPSEGRGRAKQPPSDKAIKRSRILCRFGKPIAYLVRLPGNHVGACRPEGGGGPVPARQAFQPSHFFEMARRNRCIPHSVGGETRVPMSERGEAARLAGGLIRQREGPLVLAKEKPARRDTGPRDVAMRRGQSP